MSNAKRRRKNNYSPEEFEEIFEGDTSINLQNNFGPPPYKFLSIGEPVPFKSVKHRNSNYATPEYLQKFPQPNYSQFKNPKFIDELGREYAIADDMNMVNELSIGSDIQNEHFKDPIKGRNMEHGDLLFWVRLPKGKKLKPNDEIDYDDLGKIQLIHIETQIKCTAVVDIFYVAKKRKTGYALLRNFYSIGSPSPASGNPLEYYLFLNK